MGHNLADGIYPSLETFLKCYRIPEGNKKVHFTKTQELVQLDIERAFGVLQAQFSMLRGLARF